MSHKIHYQGINAFFYKIPFLSLRHRCLFDNGTMASDRQKSGNSNLWRIYDFISTLTLVNVIRFERFFGVNNIFVLNCTVKKIVNTLEVCFICSESSTESGVVVIDRGMKTSIFSSNERSDGFSEYLKDKQSNYP